MADKTITELESIPSSSLSLDDELPVYEKTNGSTLKTTIGDLKGLCLEDAVMKAGDTMTGTLEVGRVAGGIKFRANTTNITAGDQPSSTLFGNELLGTDSSRDQIMRLTTWQGSNGALSAAFSVRNRQSASGSWNSWHQIQLAQDMNGTNHVSVTAPAAWLSALGLTATNFNLTAGTNVTISDQQSCKIGRMVFVSARITLSAQLAAYSTLATMPYSAARAWVAQLYNDTRLPLTNYSIYADSGNTTIRASVTIPAGSYRICVSIPVTS